LAFDFGINIASHKQAYQLKIEALAEWFMYINVKPLPNTEETGATYGL
jgi:hypothetical protein